MPTGHSVQRAIQEYNQQEMADARRSMWKNKLLSLLEENFREEPGGAEGS